MALQRTIYESRDGTTWETEAEADAYDAIIEQATILANLTNIGIGAARAVATDLSAAGYIIVRRDSLPHTDE